MLQQVGHGSTLVRRQTQHVPGQVQGGCIDLAIALEPRLQWAEIRLCWLRLCWLQWGAGCAPNPLELWWGAGCAPNPLVLW